MPRFLTPYQWRIPLSLLSFLFFPLLIACALFGSPLGNFITRFASRFPAGYEFLFWWDTVLILGGFILITCLWIPLGYTTAKQNHLESLWRAPLFTLTIFFLSTFFFLASQKTGLDLFVFLSYSIGTLFPASLFLPFIASKKERVIAFFTSLFFVAGSGAIIRLLALLAENGYY